MAANVVNLLIFHGFLQKRPFFCPWWSYTSFAHHFQRNGLETLYKLANCFVLPVLVCNHGIQLVKLCRDVACFCNSLAPILGETLCAALETLDAIADAFATEVATVACTILWACFTMPKVHFFC